MCFIVVLAYTNLEGFSLWAPFYRGVYQSFGGYLPLFHQSEWQTFSPALKREGCSRSREYNFHSAISSIKELIKDVHKSHESSITQACQTLFTAHWIVEHLFSKNMWPTNGTPTLLKFAYLFGLTAELPGISKTSVVKMAKKDQGTLCNIGGMHLASLSDSYV